MTSEQKYLVRVNSPIEWKGEFLKPGAEIVVTRSEFNYLGPCAVAVKLMRDEETETATERPPENASRRRR